MHARRLLVLALFSLVMGLPVLVHAEDKVVPAPAAAEPTCPHAKQAGDDCPCKKEGAKAGCPCAKAADCPCKKEGACPCAKAGACPCAKDGKDCKCPHGHAKSDEKTDRTKKTK
jgi:hypothetical protein